MDPARLTFMDAIALNARFYSHQPTGMQRYALEVSRRLAEYLQPVRPSGPLYGAAGHIWEQMRLPAAVGGRLLWSPNNTGPLAVQRQVCTIHDLAPLDHPEWYTRQFSAWYRWLLPRLAKRVRHIIAISDFTKGRIVDLLGVPAERITTIPNGIARRFSPRSSAEIQAVRNALGIRSERYLLSIASLEPRKNLRRLLEAWKMVQPPADREIELVIAGASRNKRVFGAVDLYECPPRVTWAGYVSDEQLPALYSGAAALVYPSLYEGFGLPPLEAMACGAPVVTSRGTGIPEAVGDCAILVDPEDARSIAAGISDILGNPRLAESMADRGILHARECSWERTADATLDVLITAEKESGA